MLMLILKIGNISQLSSSTPLHHTTPGNLGEMIRASNEGYLKVREGFTITENTPTSNPLLVDLLLFRVLIFQ